MQGAWRGRDVRRTRMVVRFRSDRVRCGAGGAEEKRGARPTPGEGELAGPGVDDYQISSRRKALACSERKSARPNRPAVNTARPLPPTRRPARLPRSHLNMPSTQPRPPPPLMAELSSSARRLRWAASTPARSSRTSPRPPTEGHMANCLATGNPPRKANIVAPSLHQCCSPNWHIGVDRRIVTNVEFVCHCCGPF
jgi:hypothetical protein